MSYISAAISYDRSEVLVWERLNPKERVLKKYPAPYYFYVEDEEGTFTTLYGKQVSKFDFASYEQFKAATTQFKDSGAKLYESDISPEYKVLSENYYNLPYPKLNTTFFDIEVDFDKERGFADATNPYAPVNAISIYHTHQDKMIVYAIPPNKDWTLDKIPNDLKEIAEIVLVSSEAMLLKAFLLEIENSDIISGWNSEGFDIPYLYERIKLTLGDKAANALSFPYARKPYYKEIMDRNGRTINIVELTGRVHLDLMQLVFKFEPGERDSYRLESVAEEMLKGMKKLEYEGSLADLYKNDFIHFLRYNTRDCEILKGIEEKKGFIQLSVMLSHMETSPIDDVVGTIKLTEMAIINHCHHVLNRIVPDCNRDISPSGDKYGGAYVLQPQEGLHEWVGSIDVTSLYPSAMRTINISPEVLKGQFIERSDAFIQMLSESSREISFECDGKIETRPAIEWKQIFKENKWAISAFGTAFSLEKQGVIPTLLTQWFTQRKQYKKISEAAEKEYLRLEKAGEDYKKYYDEYKFNDLLQLTFKLKLNSTYGACGNRFFRFYDIRLAESTTKTGIQILLHMARTIGQLLHGEYAYPNPAVIYGDTDSCYFKTYGQSKDESFELATLVAKKINKSFPEFCRNAFCVTENYDSFISVSQEIIADRGIFIAGKKSYMLHLVKKDGNDIDKIKITGLSIKKTTLPKPVREKISKLLEMYLKGALWADIGVKFLEFKEELLSSNDLSILGLPKNIKGFEDYCQQANDGMFNPKTPGHVRASMLWNACLEQYKDKASFKVVSGMKIRTFYLTKEFPPYKFKSIAVPVDLDTIPEWFNEHFIQLIDKEAQVERLIDGPLKSILKAINERIPSRQNLLMEELFEY